MADPVRAIVKKLLPGARKYVVDGNSYWDKRLACSRNVNKVTKTTPEQDEIVALWKSLCAAFRAELGKPTVKKSMSYSWKGVRCWYFGARANGIDPRAEWTVTVESTRRS